MGREAQEFDDGLSERSRWDRLPCKACFCLHGEHDEIHLHSPKHILPQA